MTPQREKYLAKCSKRELWLRENIRHWQGLIQSNKWALNNDKQLTEDDKLYFLSHIRKYKYQVSAYRHEIERLKGIMDRVVILEPYTDYDNLGVGKVVGKSKGVCKCDRFLREFYKYYPKRDRRILWKKVK